MPLPIDVVLQRLDGVKANGSNKWVAICPAHNDKSPSLSIRNTEDGKVLMHCFAGCPTTDITMAIGLDLQDLFPGDKRPQSGPSKSAIRHEQAVYQIGINLQMQGLVLSAEDQARLEIAKQRLGVVK